MKKFVTVLFIISALLSLGACDKTSSENTSSDVEGVSTPSSSSESSLVADSSAESEENQDAVYKDEYVDNDGNICEDWYSAHGILRRKVIKDISGAVITEESYDTQGRIEKTMSYEEDGRISYSVVYEHKNANSMYWTLYNAEGEFSEKNFSEYKNGKIDRITTYDEKDIITGEQFFGYDEKGRLIKTEAYYYENSMTSLYVLSQFSTETGLIISEDNNYYDESGNLAYVERYGIINGKYDYIGTFDKNGMPIEVEE